MCSVNQRAPRGVLHFPRSSSFSWLPFSVLILCIPVAKERQGDVPVPAPPAAPPTTTAELSWESRDKNSVRRWLPAGHLAPSQVRQAARSRRSCLPALPAPFAAFTCSPCRKRSQMLPFWETTISAEGCRAHTGTPPRRNLSISAHLTLTWRHVSHLLHLNAVKSSETLLHYTLILCFLYVPVVMLLKHHLNGNTDQFFLFYFEILILGQTCIVWCSTWHFGLNRLLITFDDRNHKAHQLEASPVLQPRLLPMFPVCSCSLWSKHLHLNN